MRDSTQETQECLINSDNEGDENETAERELLKIPDSLFTGVYLYYLLKGWKNIIIESALCLISAAFIITFLFFMTYCVNYPVLFKEEHPIKINSTEDVTLKDAILPLEVCLRGMSYPGGMFYEYILILMFIAKIKSLCYYHKIKNFYRTEMKITTKDISTMTWHEVQAKFINALRKQEKYIYQTKVSELDVCHRIFRYHNYMIAIVNKNFFPIHLEIPLLGKVIFLSETVQSIIEAILFRLINSPIQNDSQFENDYKDESKRELVANEISKFVLTMAVINLLFSPVFFVCNLFQFFIGYAEQIKNNPKFFGTRIWTNYARLYLRHFNESNDEFDYRLCRAYEPSTNYLSIFYSHTVIIVIKYVSLSSGTVFLILFLLTVYDKDVISSDYILLIISISGIICLASRSLLPSENIEWCPEKHMTDILAHIHYIPDHWKGKAHTVQVKNEFEFFFQLKAKYFLEMLISPILWPYIALKYIRPRSLDIVDFVRNYTVEIEDVGDVCSFALMDSRYYYENRINENQNLQFEDKKLDLSLINFALTNPSWNPPDEISIYLKYMQEQVKKVALDANVLNYFLNSVSSFCGQYCDLVKSILRANVDQSDDHNCLLSKSLEYIHHSQNQHQTEYQATVIIDPVLESTAANMSICALYMHEVCKIYMNSKNSRENIDNISISSYDLTLNEEETNEHQQLLSI